MFGIEQEKPCVPKSTVFRVVNTYLLCTSVFQRMLKHSRFGRISVKCYYEVSDQRLNVEILHAANLIALDANGELCTHTPNLIHNQKHSA